MYDKMRIRYKKDLFRSEVTPTPVIWFVSLDLQINQITVSRILYHRPGYIEFRSMSDTSLLMSTNVISRIRIYGT